MAFRVIAARNTRSLAVQPDFELSRYVVSYQLFHEDTVGSKHSLRLLDRPRFRNSSTFSV